MIVCCSAENVNGTDTADVIVCVLDAPGTPQGPLNVGSVNKNGCTLDWKVRRGANNSSKPALKQLSETG